jgi:hypothetical protein
MITTITMKKESDLASAGLEPPVSLVSAVAISRGVRKSERLIRV